MYYVSKIYFKYIFKVFNCSWNMMQYMILYVVLFWASEGCMCKDEEVLGLFNTIVGKKVTGTKVMYKK